MDKYEGDFEFGLYEEGDLFIIFPRTDAIFLRWRWGFVIIKIINQYLTFSKFDSSDNESKIF